MTAIARAFRTWDDGIDEFFSQVRSALAAESHYTLVLRLTLLLVVLHGATSPFAAVVVRILSLLMLTLPALATRLPLWCLLTLTLVATTLDQWDLVDNHQYLMTYWVAACTLTLGRPADLRTTARLLVATAFIFAAIWKIAGGQFLDGSFFYLTFLTDGRLQNVASVLAGAGAGSVRESMAAIAHISASGVAGAQFVLDHNQRILTAALALSWTGLAIESLVGLLHALPGERLSLARHVLLMVFVGATYILLPVTGFGFLLAVMGFAQLREDAERLKRWYLILLCFLQVTLVPWRNLLSAF